MAAADEGAATPQWASTLQRKLGVAPTPRQTHQFGFEPMGEIYRQSSAEFFGSRPPVLARLRWVGRVRAVHRPDPTWLPCCHRRWATPPRRDRRVRFCQQYGSVVCRGVDLFPERCVPR